VGVGDGSALVRTVGRGVPLRNGVRVGSAVGRRVGVGVSGAGVAGMRRASPAPDSPASRIGW